MATCPQCRGHLTDGHRCPRGRLRRRVEIGVIGLAGGTAGLLLLGLLDPAGLATDLEGLSFVAGTLLAIGAHTMLRR